MLTARCWWCVGRVVARSLYEELARSYALCFRELGMPENHAPTLRHYLLQDIAYSYRVWITLIMLLSAPLWYLKSKPDIHLPEYICGRLLPLVLRFPRRTLLGNPVNEGSSPPSDTPKLLDVLDVDESAPQFHGSFVLEPTKSPGYRLPLGSDHGSQALVGVVRWELVALRGHNTPSLY